MDEIQDQNQSDESGEIITDKEVMLITSGAKKIELEHSINRTEISPTKSEDSFYEDAKTYWRNVEPTLDGMLGGFSSLTQIDIRGSQTFLKELYKLKPTPERRRALDCGAGIGRVTKYLLIPLYDQVDAVEQDQHFTSKLPDYVGPTQRLGYVYTEGLQTFNPEPNTYDLIWTQWVLGHLTDTDLIKFIKRCTKSLRRNGIMVIKENVTSNCTFEADQKDSSITRSLPVLKKIIEDGGMRIIKQTKQFNFPQGLFPVYMFAVRPIHRK